MVDPTDPRTRAWVENWQRVGKLLEAIELEELRHFRYEDHYDAIDALLQYAYLHGESQSTSGLVEQQRWFRKWREAQAESQP